MTRTHMRLECIRYEAHAVSSFEFRPVDGEQIKNFAPGAHVDLHLPNGLTRQYSLVNLASESASYVVAVKREPDSRGGSAFMHDQMRVGMVIDVGAPRNNFPLREDANHSVLIAGGIGITPIVAMVKRLRSLRRSFELHYATRSRNEAAFLDVIAGEELHLHVDAEQGVVMDVKAIAARAPVDSHLYCCGPAPMLEAFEAAVSGRPDSFVHIERFASKEDAGSTNGFTVELARTGRRIQVRAGQTILSALRDQGICPRTSCEQGFCGTCETRVLAGVPDHRDSFFTDEEKSTNTASMLICCGSSKSDLLVLDL